MYCRRLSDLRLRILELGFRAVSVYAFFMVGVIGTIIPRLFIRRFCSSTQVYGEQNDFPKHLEVLGSSFGAFSRLQLVYTGTDFTEVSGSTDIERPASLQTTSALHVCQSKHQPNSVLIGDVDVMSPLRVR